ncbi:MAG: hypothetical protein HZC38_21300 [Chloroflexi bacterium]|nr:hypothetical protein [Chloroflexota bacterium]
MRQLSQRLLNFLFPLILLALACASPNVPNPYRAPTLIPLIKPTNTAMPTLTSAPPTTPPTRLPTSTPTSTHTRTPSPQVNPRVELRLSATTLKVGETLSVTAQAVDLGLPIFYVRVKDGAGDFQEMVQITYDNKTRNVKDVSRVLEFVSGSGGLNQATVVFRGRAAGAASIQINATGEIHYGYPGPATFGGGSSPAISIQVNP